jgi:hypothetical protein
MPWCQSGPPAAAKSPDRIPAPSSLQQPKRSLTVFSKGRCHVQKIPYKFLYDKWRHSATFGLAPDFIQDATRIRRRLFQWIFRTFGARMSEGSDVANAITIASIATMFEGRPTVGFKRACEILRLDGKTLRLHLASGRIASVSVGNGRERMRREFTVGHIAAFLLAGTSETPRTTRRTAAAPSRAVRRPLSAIAAERESEANRHDRTASRPGTRPAAASAAAERRTMTGA